MTGLPLEFQPYFLLVVIFSLFFSIYKNWVQPTAGFLFAVLILLFTGILTPEKALSGLSNPAIAIVILLVLITAGVRTNYNVEGVLDKLFGKRNTYKSFLLSMMAKVAVLSSFVNNTSVVVLMTPYVFNWGRKNNVSPSKLLIPLSYATIVGGMITVIGTSTTLVLNGFLAESEISEIKPLDLLIIGSVVVIVCLLFLWLASNKLLPQNEDIIDQFQANKREYLIEKRLSKNSPLIGTSVADGLRNLKGVYLVEIVRGNELISPVKPSEVIQEKDTLIFAGNTDNIVDLTLKDIGLELPPKLAKQYSNKIRVVESVISANSSIVGKTIKESDFRSRYDAAVVAVHRNGEKLSGKIGRIRIMPGDVLLMYVGDQFYKRVDLYKDLYVISGEDKEIVSENESSNKLYIVLGVVGLLLFNQVLGIFDLGLKHLDLLMSLLIVFTTMVGLKLLTIKHIKRDLDMNMAIILVLSLALGHAMQSSQADKLIAHHLEELLTGHGNLPILLSLMILTTILTSFITNVGAVAIAFPIAYAITSDLGVAGTPFYLGIAFAASSAFLTPIGYQTNLIVYGPGGYTFKDFFRIGLPTTVVYLGTAIAMIVALYNEVFF